jgi:DNA repair protein RadC
MRQLCFSLLPDGPENKGDASSGVPLRPRRYRQVATYSPRVAETLRADQDVRARLRACGPDALTPVEALTVLLGERSLLPAARLLAAFGSLTALVRASPAELARWVSEEQAWGLAAATRLHALAALDQARHECLDSPEAVYRLLAPPFAAFHEERLMAVLLDTRYRPLKAVLISSGTVNESLAHPREIFKPAIAHSAYAFILAHNHPSGDPSRERGRPATHPRGGRGRAPPADPPLGSRHLRAPGFFQLQGGGVAMSQADDRQMRDGVAAPGCPEGRFWRFDLPPTRGDTAGTKAPRKSAPGGGQSAVWDRRVDGGGGSRKEARPTSDGLPSNR